MKYLKYFKRVSDRNVWENSTYYVTPSVSYTIEDNYVDFNQHIIEKIIMQLGNKYPNVAAGFASIVSKYAKTSLNKLINDAPAYTNGWRSDYSTVENVQIDVIGDYSYLDSDRKYKITFMAYIGLLNPNVADNWDWDNVNWDDPAISGKCHFISEPIELELSSEDNDFIKSLVVEQAVVSYIEMNNEDFDSDTGKIVPNHGIFNKAYIALSTYDLNDSYSGYELNYYTDYELIMPMSPA